MAGAAAATGGAIAEIPMEGGDGAGGGTGVEIHRQRRRAGEGGGGDHGLQGGGAGAGLAGIGEGVGNIGLGAVGVDCGQVISERAAADLGGAGKLPGGRIRGLADSRGVLIDTETGDAGGSGVIPGEGEELEGEQLRIGAGIKNQQVGGCAFAAVAAHLGHAEGHGAADEVGLAGDGGDGGVAGLAEQAVVQVEAIAQERGLVGWCVPAEGKELGTGGGFRGRANGNNGFRGWCWDGRRLRGGLRDRGRFWCGLRGWGRRRWFGGGGESKGRGLRALGVVAEGGGQGEIGGGGGQGHLAVHGSGVGVLGLAGQTSFLVQLKTGHRR